MTNSNYLNSLAELEKRFNFEKEEKTKFPFFKLDRTNKLMNLLGNPQNDKSFTIHIAGTNGKGTVSSIINSIIGQNFTIGDNSLVKDSVVFSNVKLKKNTY